MKNIIKFLTLLTIVTLNSVYCMGIFNDISPDRFSENNPEPRNQELDQNQEMQPENQDEEKDDEFTEDFGSNRF